MFGKLEIKIGGETRRMTFGQNAWYLFTKMNGITPDKIRVFMSDQLQNPAAFRDITYCGLKASDLALGKTVDYNEFLVGEWMDDMNEKDLSLVIQTILESLGVSTGKPIKKKVKEK